MSTGGGDPALVAQVSSLQSQLVSSKRQLAEALGQKFAQEEEMLVLTNHVESLRNAVEELRASAARKHDKIASGSVLGTIVLDPAVAREVGTLKAEWQSAQDLAAGATVEAREAHAVSSVLQGEMALLEEVHKQNRMLVENANRSAIKSQREAESVRAQLHQVNGAMMELRATEAEQTAALGMADAQEHELRAALAEAEREIVATRQRGEEAVARVEHQRDAEALAHKKRAKDWQDKLREFLETGQQRGMDLRVFVTNEPIYVALMASLKKEEDLAHSYSQRLRLTQDEQAAAEVALLNSRLNSMTKLTAELRAIAGTGVAEARAVGAASYDGDVQELSQQLVLAKSDIAEREELAAERERWAEEQVAEARRLFEDAISTLQHESLSRHRESTQKMVVARSRAALLAERNEAMRDMLGERGSQAWRRRCLLATWRAWRDMYVRNRFQRLESEYRLRLRQRVEDEVKIERREHAEALSNVSAQASALGEQLSQLQAADRIEIDRMEREHKQRLKVAREEVDEMRSVAQSYLNARLGEVEVEREKRELAETGLAHSHDEHQQLAERQRQRWQSAVGLAEERCKAAEAEATKLREEVHVLRLGDSMSSAAKAASEADQQRAIKYAAKSEARLRNEVREAQAKWHAEREALVKRNESLIEEIRLAELAARAEVQVHAEARAAEGKAYEAQEVHTAEAMAALREEVTIANLAAQISSEHHDAELKYAHAALARAKQSTLHKLDRRWEHMLLVISWQAWKLEHSARMLAKAPTKARAYGLGDAAASWVGAAGEELMRSATAGSDVRRISFSLAPDDEEMHRTASRTSQGSGDGRKRGLIGFGLDAAKGAAGGGGWRRRGSEDQRADSVAGPSESSRATTAGADEGEKQRQMSVFGVGAAKLFGGRARRSSKEVGGESDGGQSDGGRSSEDEGGGGRKSSMIGSLVGRGLSGGRTLTGMSGASASSALLGGAGGKSASGVSGVSGASGVGANDVEEARRASGLASQAQAEYAAALAKYRADMADYEERLLPAYVRAQEDHASREEAQRPEATLPAATVSSGVVSVEPASTNARAAARAADDDEMYEYEYAYEGEDEAAGEDPWRVLGEIKGALRHGR